MCFIGGWSSQVQVKVPSKKGSGYQQPVRSNEYQQSYPDNEGADINSRRSQRTTERQHGVQVCTFITGTSSCACFFICLNDS